MENQPTKEFGVLNIVGYGGSPDDARDALDMLLQFEFNATTHESESGHVVVVLKDNSHYCIGLQRKKGLRGEDYIYKCFLQTGPKGAMKVPRPDDIWI